MHASIWRESQWRYTQTPQTPQQSVSNSRVAANHGLYMNDQIWAIWKVESYLEGIGSLGKNLAKSNSKSNLAKSSLKLSFYKCFSKGCCQNTQVQTALHTHRVHLWSGKDSHCCCPRWCQESLWEANASPFPYKGPNDNRPNTSGMGILPAKHVTKVP